MKLNTKVILKPMLLILAIIAISSKSPINSFAANKYIPSDAIKWNQNGHYYKLYEISKKPEQAQKFCKSKGGHLVSITSEKEQKFIEKLIENCTYNAITIGGTDKKVEGVWKWMSGEKWKYTNWDSGEPNNGLGSGQNYLQIYTSSGKWDDFFGGYDGGNDIKEAFICEWDTSKAEKIQKIELSNKNINLCLVNSKTKKLIAKTTNIQGKIKWKSSNKNIITVNNNGIINAVGSGTATITAYTNRTEASCKVNVTDTADIVVTYRDFDNYESWSKAVNAKEQELVFGGSLFTLPNDNQYYTGNIIVNRTILAAKTVNAKISFNTPGFYTSFKLSLPTQVKYTLHRHNLQNDIDEENTSKLLVGLMEQNLVWVQQCSCGYKETLTWTLPIDKKDEITAEETYVMSTTSSSF